MRPRLAYVRLGTRPLANRTVHGVLHPGWVEDGAQHRGQMAVLVKPNGRLGRLYLAAIAPFRHLVVYPALLRDVERRWERELPERRERLARELA